MKYRICVVILAAAGALRAFEGTGSMMAPVDEQAQEISVSFVSGRNQTEGIWYQLEPGGTLHRGWLQADRRFYYMDEVGAMATGWWEADGGWYYFHEDRGINPGELILDNGKYESLAQGTLVSVGQVENTGEGAYDVGCYDYMAQDLFDQLNEEKKYLSSEEYPDREDEYDGDMHRVYDQYTGSQMDMTLNKAADHRLEGAIVGGYIDDRIPGEGTIDDYLPVINYRRSASCPKLYVKDCEDASEAFDKIKEKLDKRFQSKTDRKYSLEYYRSLGMVHREEDGKQYSVVILMRRV